MQNMVLVSVCSLCKYTTITRQLLYNVSVEAIEKQNFISVCGIFIKRNYILVIIVCNFSFFKETY